MYNRNLILPKAYTRHILHTMALNSNLNLRLTDFEFRAIICMSDVLYVKLYFCDITIP